MANKAMWDWMDKAEGKKVGSSHANMQKERIRQGYKKVASKMKLDKPSKGNADKSPRTAKADY